MVSGARGFTLSSPLSVIIAVKAGRLALDRSGALRIWVQIHQVEVMECALGHRVQKGRLHGT